jgi:hypothetical protein
MRARYLGDSDWDQRWAPEAPNDGSGDDGDGGDGGGHDGDFDDADDDNGRQPPPSPPSCDDGTNKEVHDDTDDFVSNVVYNVLLANERGEHYELPPELTEDEQLTTRKMLIGRIITNGAHLDRCATYIY